jgi:hypothetical protein
VINNDKREQKMNAIRNKNAIRLWFSIVNFFYKCNNNPSKHNLILETKPATCFG